MFAVVLGGTKHNVVTAPGCTKQILNQRSTLSNTELTYYLLTKFFGDRGTIRDVNPELVFHDISKQLHGLMREPFLSNAIAVTVRGIEERTPNLVSFAGSIVDQTVWERAGNLELVQGSVPTVEVSLFPLVRNFVGDLACEVLLGRNFMDVRHYHSSQKISRKFIASIEGAAKSSDVELFLLNINIALLTVPEQSEYSRRLVDLGWEIQPLSAWPSGLATRIGTGFSSSGTCTSGSPRAPRSFVRCRRRERSWEPME
jgi:hypothetical protein